MSAQQDQDAPQGAGAIRRAAVETVARYLDSFACSMARDDLWEEHPLLVEWEANLALMQADELIRMARDFFRFMGEVEHVCPPPSPSALGDRSAAGTGRG